MHANNLRVLDFFEDEGVAAYVAELRKLTEHCNFGELLPEML